MLGYAFVQLGERTSTSYWTECNVEDFKMWWGSLVHAVIMKLQFEVLAHGRVHRYADDSFHPVKHLDKVDVYGVLMTPIVCESNLIEIVGRYRLATCEVE